MSNNTDNNETRGEELATINENNDESSKAAEVNVDDVPKALDGGYGWIVLCASFVCSLLFLPPFCVIMY